jgi:hypothetical protein
MNKEMIDFCRQQYQQIERLHSRLSDKHSFIVYRGQGMSNHEF